MTAAFLEPRAVSEFGSLDGPHRRPTCVLHVLPSLAGGGMERATLRLIRASGSARILPASANADDRAFSHALCVLKEADRSLLQAYRPPARVWVLGENAHPSRRLSSWWRLRRVIRRLRPDIVHARSTGAWADAALATRRLAGVRLLLSFHGRTQLSRPMLRRRLLNRWAAHQADAVLTVSAESAEYLRREHGVARDKLFVIRNGVNTDRFRPPADEAEASRARGELGLGPADRIVICVANFMPIKALDVLLHAWTRVIARQPAARLLLAGDGPLRDELQGLSWNLGCRHSVLFAGVRENVPELLRAADLFVLPSRYEACSNAILEAMASGLAVVACDTGGNRELVMPGETGWLVRPDSPEELAGRILDSLSDDRGRRRAGRAGRERAVTACAETNWLAACGALYESLAAGAAGNAEANSCVE